jgi:secreted trypsin-like serine protease
MRPSLLLVLTAAIFVAADYARCEVPGQINITLPSPAPGPIDAAGPRALGVSEGGLSPRVLRGRVSTNETVVAIYYTGLDGRTYICSGTMLTAGVVLTAGHCGCGIAGSYRVTSRQDARNPVALSELIPLEGAPLLFDQRVCRIGQLADGNDLALLRLDKDKLLLKHLDGYPPDSVFSLRKFISKGAPLTVIGYGYTESRGIGTRMEGEVSVYSFDCEEAKLAEICGPFSEMILSDQGVGRPANDTCGGDSGGPVFWGSRLVAVTSRAAPGTQENAALHCGGGGIYSLIGRKSVQDWFRANGLLTQPEIRESKCKAASDRKKCMEGNG